MEELIATFALGDQILPYLVKMVAAFVLALPIAINREKSTQIMGLRTFPLVAVASCGFLLMATAMFETNDDAIARVLQGLITGIGFIGGGAILKNDGAVKGTATAASIWATGALGASIAFGYLNIALMITIITFVVLRLFTPLKIEVDQDDEAAP